MLNVYDIQRLSTFDYVVLMEYGGRSHELYRCNGRAEAEQWLVDYLAVYDDPDQITDIDRMLDYG